LTLATISHAFFVGFGSAGGVEQVIKKGQDEGKIPKVPDTGETTPAGPIQHGAEVIWQKAWNGGGNDFGRGIAIDDTGNVYVIGVFNADYLTIKYNSNGDIVWQKAWNGGKDDLGYGIAVDDTGNVYVTGCSSNGSNWDYLTIKYNSNGDTIIWQKRWDGGVGNDEAYGIVVDDTGNVYVTGYSYNGTNNDFMTIKYNSSGDTIWQKKYSSGNDEKSNDIAVDDAGNVYVTGYSSNGVNWDCLTIKYNSNGDIVWQKRWDGGSDDVGNGIAVDSSGNVYVTGNSFNGANDDCLTIKYNSNGDIVWQKRWDGGSYDYGNGIAVDSSGNVYVTGQSWNVGNDYDYLTIKYNSNGNTIWQKVWNGGFTDRAYGIAVGRAPGGLGNVYVTGDSLNGANYDYLTIKYRQY